MCNKFMSFFKLILNFKFDYNFKLNQNLNFNLILKITDLLFEVLLFRI